MFLQASVHSATTTSYCSGWNASYWNAFLLRILLPPANEVCEGNYFTDVCLSTGGGGGSLSKGLSSGGISVWGTLCLGGGYLSRGVSVQGWSLS